jgi:hypothetical protein
MNSPSLFFFSTFRSSATLHCLTHCLLQKYITGLLLDQRIFSNYIGGKFVEKYFKERKSCHKSIKRLLAGDGSKEKIP